MRTRTVNDRTSDIGSVETALPDRTGSVARASHPGTENAWISTWGVLNTPAGFAVSLVVALGGLAALFLTVFLGQLNRMEDRLEAQMGVLETSLQTQIDELETSLQTQIDELETSLQTQIEELKDAMRASEQRLVAQINRGKGETGEQ